MSKGKRNRRRRRKEDPAGRDRTDPVTSVNEYSLRDLENDVAVELVERRAAETCPTSVSAEAARVIWRSRLDPADLAHRCQEECHRRSATRAVIPFSFATLIAYLDRDRSLLEMWRWGERGELGAEPVKGGYTTGDLN